MIFKLMKEKQEIESTLVNIEKMIFFEQKNIIFINFY